MLKKIYDANPIAKKLEDNVFKYEYDDGSAVTVDYVSHNREKSPYAIKHQADLKRREKNSRESETMNLRIKKLKKNKSY